MPKIINWSVNRKLKLCLLISVLTYLSFLLPPIIFNKIILTGTEYVSVISIILTAYFGTNVYQKKTSLKQEDPSKEPNPEGE